MAVNLPGLVLIIDDSPYDRSLLSRVFDHSTGRFLKGFRMLTICWSDGTSCLPMDFALLSSSDAKKRLCDSQKPPDKRSCAYQRRKEATEKATVHLETMVKRILSTGVSAKYLLMDSLFIMPATVIALAQHIKVIGMVKKSSRTHYRFNGQALDLMVSIAGLQNVAAAPESLQAPLHAQGRGYRQAGVCPRQTKEGLAGSTAN